jgi:aspartyl-tRNA(Asn)/glutamyl-tRNA(Gln) amidotransferase subunit C
MVTIEEVKKLAKLSHLKLNEQEAEKYQAELNAILGYVEQLQSVDIEGLEPTYQVSGNKNVVREDVVDQSLYQTTLQKLMSNAPGQIDGQLKVKKVL